MVICTQVVKEEQVQSILEIKQLTQEKSDRLNVSRQFFLKKIKTQKTKKEQAVETLRRLQKRVTASR